MTNVDESTIRSLPDEQIKRERDWLLGQGKLDQPKANYLKLIESEIKRRYIMPMPDCKNCYYCIARPSENYCIVYEKDCLKIKKCEFRR